MMKVLSVNCSKPRPVTYKDKTVMTGIFKEPVQGRVRVRRLGLECDGQADLENHGGIYQAVYAYPVEHYRSWAAALGRPDFPYGQFGENLTVQGLTEDDVHIGDVFRIGGALLEVTQPRVPCYKLGIKMDDEGFPKLFFKSLRTGFYLRVREEGEVGANDAIQRVTVGAGRLSVREVFRLAYHDQKDLAGARKAGGNAALSPGWRAIFEERLAKAE